MKKETLVGTSTDYNAVKSMVMYVHELEITDQMLQSCQQSRTKYDLYLMDQKKAKKQRRGNQVQ